MAKLKPSSIGLTLGSMLAVLYAIRTIILFLFPDFVVNVANKIMYSMISIKSPVITIDAFVIGVVVLFFAGFVLGTIFSLVYNKFNK